MKSPARPLQRNSGRVLAFFALAVVPPAVLSACGSLFNKDVDAGADAAVAVVDAAPAVESVEPALSAPLASTIPTPVVVGPASAKKADAGPAAVDAAAPVVVVDSGIPRPLPSGMKVPGLPSGFKIPSGIPSRFLPR